MEQEDNRPKWLLELENRKRKPRLAHEAGAGAPCLICISACPGLDLHFWRKICKICKCGRDDHDFEDEEFPQFDLLFGPSGKLKKRSVFLPIKKQNHDETPFEWVPPDTSKELAADYMKALPSEKLPIKGSAGAVFRRQQLQKQLPLHDIDHQACDALTDEERKQFEEYVENLKNYVGQGKVEKVTGARPFSRTLMTPANATDVQRSPQHKPAASAGQGLNLRTPSSFMSKNPPLPTNHLPFSITEPPSFPSIQTPPVPLPELPSLPLSLLPIYPSKLPNIQSNAIPRNLESLRVQSLGSIVENSPQGRYHRALVNIPNDENFEKSVPADALNIPLTTRPFTQLLRQHAKALESNFSNPSNQPAGDSTSQNIDPCQQSVSVPGLQEKNDNSGIVAHLEGTGRIDSRLEESRGLPHDIAERLLSEAFLPPSAIHVNDIVASTLDERGLTFIRDKLNSKYSNKGDVEHRGPFESREIEGHQRPGIVYKEVERLSSTLPNQFSTCESQTMHSHHPQLTEALSHGNLPGFDPVKAALQKSSTNPHRCFSANQNLQTASLSHSNRNLNSSPSYSLYAQNIEPLQAELGNYGAIARNVINSELLHNPIFPEEAIGETPKNTADVDQLAKGVENFNITPTKQKCHECREQINVGEVVVTAEKAKNEVWHPGCFVCSVCNELLADLVYFFYKEKLYCGRDLATHLDVQRCFACDELIFTSMYTVAEGHCYHVKHFCCWDCDEPLAGQQYTSENDRPLCLPCYQKTYAKTCSACHKAIAADQQGVAIKNLDFHVDEKCFCCFTCKKSLLNGKVGVKENRAFCSKECIAKFQSQQS
ncbi:uncharacterized protein LOC117168950 [Belonocnema kinseyi]|uniref:uncharacterized protein LOC117168950 n=1 Tax=Belonocnema kinseyi TaxID=2817044 RepID=UPI00143DE6C9|nr:uncharacterized protein LOC117168950 [Belonocnema kinseyi]